MVELRLSVTKSMLISGMMSQDGQGVTAPAFSRKLRMGLEIKGSIWLAGDVAG